VRRKRKLPLETLAVSRSRSSIGEIFHRIRKSIPSMIALVYIVMLILVSVFSEQIAPYDYSAIDLKNKLAFPSREHLMGTDEFGRDLFSRILVGGKVSLIIAVLAIAISLVAAIVIGSIAGYYGGRKDNIIMRILDVFMAIPGLVLAIAISTALGGGNVNTAIAISVGGIPSFVRIMRSSVLLIRSEEYIETARAFGARDFRIMMKHLVPNSLSPMIVQTSLRLGNAIMVIASLSFIGLGVMPPTPEWGNILAKGRDYLDSFWPMMVFPGIMLCITMLAFNVLGDGLRDALDPRLKN
jgi:peptide/nickel transport system permease protein